MRVGGRMLILGSGLGNWVTKCLLLSLHHNGKFQFISKLAVHEFNKVKKGVVQNRLGDGLRLRLFFYRRDLSRLECC